MAGIFGQFNGVSPFLHRQWQSNEGIDLFTDAAASIGFGGYFNGKWFHAKWAPELLALSPSIAFLEFYPLVVAVYCWGDLLANHKVRFRCDYSAVVHIINKQTSRCDIMHLVRLFVCLCLRCNIAFKAIHVGLPGVRNDIADSFSRFHWRVCWVSCTRLQQSLLLFSDICSCDVGKASASVLSLSLSVTLRPTSPVFLSRFVWCVTVRSRFALLKKKGHSRNSRQFDRCHTVVF